MKGKTQKTLTAMREIDSAEAGRLNKLERKVCRPACLAVSLPGRETDMPPRPSHARQWWKVIDTAPGYSAVQKAAYTAKHHDGKPAAGTLSYDAHLREMMEMVRARAVREVGAREGGSVDFRRKHRRRPAVNSTTAHAVYLLPFRSSAHPALPRGLALQRNDPHEPSLDRPRLPLMLRALVPFLAQQGDPSRLLTPFHQPLTFPALHGGCLADCRDLTCERRSI